VVPLYSKSGNYNVTVLNTNTTNTTKNATGNNPNVYVDLQAIYSLGSGGEALAFNQEMTYVLLYVLGVGVAISAFATAGLVALIIGIGMGTILLYDELGGGNGVFFFTHTGILYQYAWINSPYNQVPNDLKNYGSSPVILYSGDLQ